MRVAVVLHGHIRMWEFCKDNIVSTISEIYKDFDVDWMIGFWKTNTYQNASEYLKSKNQNVVAYEIFDSSTPLYKQREDTYGYNLPSNVGRWYLRQKLGIKRRLLEIKNSIKYEIIVYIRPDIYFIPWNEKSSSSYNRFYKMISENETLRTRYQLQAGGDYTDFWNHSQAIREIGVDDMFTVAGSLTADLFDHCYTEYNDATKYLETYKIGFGDSSLPTATYFTQHSITSSYPADTMRGKLFPVVIRPHTQFEELQTLHSQPEVALQLKYVNEWASFNTEVKKQWCSKNNIDFQDYGIM